MLCPSLAPLLPASPEGSVPLEPSLAPGPADPDVKPDSAAPAAASAAASPVEDSRGAMASARASAFLFNMPLFQILARQLVRKSVICGVNRRGYA